ncbi:MAG: transcriptional regulator [Candidatus Omnitrophica bacterium CG11_big_fil_rev_8_21_14_0_20_45_26]|uniref:Transcriptional regulator n=1 Tax=Candidatus Abzuiibacterium crystallinum TaxID=1974748 RepID=A0A2H0LN18_9BACT|nr:MAG: transcriptional regulator [Candidatus Omnitrophica bacterium CG11_big_fil_rev_8_21_14_0_20_45_26]PIW65526.1 MAG: transcriptional regulator [Candidatus Omnitrophica bacterium CG12_big_fil_rev_8_21_14_0_65_45_16]
MKLITAFIQPHKLTAVKDALQAADVTKMSVTNALGCGQQQGYLETYRGVKHRINLLKKVRLDIAVNDNYVDKALEAIIESAKSGKIGDGKIFVTDLAQCIRIRTGERGHKAIG